MPTKTDAAQNSTHWITPWWVANMAVKVSATTTAISLITHPLGVVLSHSQAGKLGCLAFNATLYRGLMPSIYSGHQRGVVNISAKVSSIGRAREAEIMEKTNGVEVLAKGNDSELTAPNPYARLLRYGEAGGFSQIELLATTVHSNLSKLAGAKVYPVKSLYELGFANTKELFKMGYGFKSAHGLVSVSALCILSDYMSHKFSFNNKVVNDLAGGASAGAISAVLTHPLVTAGDALILGTKVNNDTGQLSRMTHSMFFKGCANHVREVGIKQAITKVLGKALFELPLRTVNGMIIFATIQASMGLMGDEPLAVVRNKFFPEADATPPQVGEDGAKAAPTTSGPTPASIPVSVSEHKAEPKPGTPEPATGPRSF